MKYKNSIASMMMATLAAVLMSYAGITHAADSPAVGQAIDGPFLRVATPLVGVGIEAELDALQSALCPSGELPRTTDVGAARSWACGPWVVLSAPERATDSRDIGWVISYSAIVKPGKAESIADAVKECIDAKGTLTSKSDRAMECKIVNAETEETISYSRSTVEKSHMFLGFDWFWTDQEEMTIRQTVHAVNGVDANKG